MIEPIRYITENPLVSTILATVFISAASLLLKRVQRSFHTKKIISFLSESAEQGKYQFRSTEAIASAVGLTESRVEEICSSNKSIRRNSAQRQSWTLTER
jgi:hypothetical protein